MISGQAIITINKADGRKVESVIHNDIVDDVFTELRGKIISSTDSYVTYIPSRIKITLSGGSSERSYTAPASNVDVNNTDGATKVYAEYSLITPPSGSDFTESGGYVTQVDLMASDGTTAIATATASNTTFTAGSDTSSSDVVDNNDTVSCTYRLQFQSFDDSSKLYAQRLLLTLQGQAHDISMNTYRLTDVNDGEIKKTDNLLIALATSGTYSVTGTPLFTNVPTSPTNLELLTSDGVRIMKQALSTGVGNASTLSGFTAGDNIKAPFVFTLTKVTSAVS